MTSLNENYFRSKALIIFDTMKYDASGCFEVNPTDGLRVVARELIRLCDEADKAEMERLKAESANLVKRYTSRGKLIEPDENDMTDQPGVFVCAQCDGPCQL